MANNKCKECGCLCSTDHDVHLHVEIENLKQRLVERDNHILKMETNFLNETNKFPNGEVGAIKEELLTWQDKYKRLYEAHRRVQRVNQGLEDKLLKLVDTCETDKGTLTKDVATLSHKLAEANYTIKKLTEDNERYKNDVALAIQLLQCKPGNFISQKVDALPNEVQAKVSSYLQGKRKQPEEKKLIPEVKSIKVPIPTFPPTAMVYSVNQSKKITPTTPSERHPDYRQQEKTDLVSAAIMAKILQEREKERANIKHCDTCVCSRGYKIVRDIERHTIGTQTGEESRGLKITKNSDSIRTGKNVPIYIHDTNFTQNIAKVQPNNFLAIDFVTEKPQPVSEPKGPRFCSMRLQGDSRNILLDNTRGNVRAPVLYTRHHQKVDPKEPKNQRIAEWIESNTSEEVSRDKDKYEEMENNVKRFLFGESEFLRTNDFDEVRSENDSSLTETDI